ncbi:MAG: AAA family ATPase, partial [Acetobacteraceae bacterium]
AFLLMDLDTRASRAAANRVLNRYLARGGDLGLLAGLAPFLSLRALIRAHIRAGLGAAAEAAGLAQAALAYLDPAAARLVAIGGLMGTGKSTLARALAPQLGAAPGAVVLRSDEIRKRLCGAMPEEHLPPAAYGTEMGARVNAALVASAREALAAGQSAVLDGTFLDPALREAAERLAGEANVPFTGLWLSAPAAVLEARLAARTGDASDADVGVLRRALAAAPAAPPWREIPASDAEAALAAARSTLV